MNKLSTVHKIGFLQQLELIDNLAAVEGNKELEIEYLKKLKEFPETLDLVQKATAEELQFRALQKQKTR